MNEFEKVRKCIENNKDEMIKMLQEFIQIPSVVGPAEGDMPFGKNVHEAFMFMIDRAEKDGFETFNADNYGGHIEFGGKNPGEEYPGGKNSDEDKLGEKNSDENKSDEESFSEKEFNGNNNLADAEIMGIVGHVDVVPVGDGWTYHPFGGEIHDGKIYGRGTLDDKGPVIASYFAMKALKDAGIIPSKKVRLLLGNDEETNWHGMRYYLEKTDAPDFGFTPDCEFPALQGEMGVMVFEIVKQLAKSNDTGLELSSLKGGTVPNMVPDFARAVVRSTNKKGHEKVYEQIKEKVAQFRKEKNVKINCKGVGKSFEITVTGVASHGSRPQDGQNAISIMMDFLGGLNFINDDVSDFIEFYNTYIGYDYNGGSIGAGLCDQPSGKLIFNTGIVELDAKSLTLTINVRYPVTNTADDVYDAIRPVLDKYDYGVVKAKNEKPIYLPEDDHLISTLMDIYREHTGEYEIKPRVLAGATYARMFKKCVGFGALFPGSEDVGHEKNEFYELDKLILATEIYADAIYRLACDK